MTPNDYILAIRHRWADVVLAVAVALIAGWVITSVAPPAPAVASFQATAALLETGDPIRSGGLSIDALSALVTVGEVPAAVAKDVGYQGSPDDLATLVRTDADSKTGILSITAYSRNASQAVLLANTFSREISTFLQDQQTEALQRKAAAVDKLRADIAQLSAQIAHARGNQRDLLVSQHTAKLHEYGLAYDAYALAAADPAHMQILQQATPVEEPGSGFRAPQSLLSRLFLAGFLGLVAGVVLVLVLERVDLRIRTRADAEQHFGFPVLAEIPYLKRARRQRRGIAVLDEPKSRSADAFRLVGTMTSMPLAALKKLGTKENGNGNGNGHAASGNGKSIGEPALIGADGEAAAKTIVVTSPGPSDGKTTVVANLAAALAARGRRVIVISADLRRPRIHKLLGNPEVSNETGLVARLRDNGNPAHLSNYMIETNVPGVSMIPSSHIDESGDLLSSDSMRDLIEDAADHADVVLIDTAPILSTTDSATLMSWVDAVLVVGRAGRTTSPVAEGTSEILGRLQAPVVGVVLNAAAEITRPGRYYYGYYGYYGGYYGSSGGGGKPRLLRRSGKG